VPEEMILKLILSSIRRMFITSFRLDPPMYQEAEREDFLHT